jgi:hypothetical protein
MASRSDETSACREVRSVFAFDGEPPADAHPKIAQLIRHVQGLAPAHGMLPGRQHFDPIRVPALLPHLWLVDVVRDDPRRYRVRLVGGGLIDAGTPIRQGKFLGDVTADNETRAFHELFDRILAAKHIDWRRGPSVVPHMKYVAGLERVLIPLAADGQAVDMLMCMTLFFWQDGRVY